MSGRGNSLMSKGLNSNNSSSNSKTKSKPIGINTGGSSSSISTSSSGSYGSPLNSGIHYYGCQSTIVRHDINYSLPKQEPIPKASNLGYVTHKNHETKLYKGK
eukprot:TCONS_00048211-protein